MTDQEQIQRLSDEVKRANKSLDDHLTLMAQKEKDYLAGLKAKDEANAKDKEALSKKHEGEVKSLKAAHDKALAAAIAEPKEVRDTRLKHQAEAAELAKKHQADREALS